MGNSAVDVVAKKTLNLRRQIKSCPDCGQRFGIEATFCPFDGSKLESLRLEPSVDPLVGTTIDGRYEVRGLLGEGGMGLVYEVRHKMLGRSFAMKLLRREVARDPGLTERFIHEAKATASIKHPHIVSITDFGQVGDGTPYFVMELLIGQTLAEYIRTRGPVPLERAYPILVQIAGALGAAHEAGVVHRDLKPDNIFLTRAPGTDLLDGADDVRVVDFGVAKVLGASRATKAGIVFGTPHYMSPEQASGQPVDHRADIYALGVIMYEMLTGRVPFEGSTYMGVLTQHMFVPPRPPSDSRPELAGRPGGLEDITLRALEKKPEDRYQTMNSVRADLERAAIREAPRPSTPAPAYPATANGATPATVGRDSSDRLASGVLSPPPRRAALVAGVGVAVGAAVVASLAWPSRPGPASVPASPPPSSRVSVAEEPRAPAPPPSNTVPPPGVAPPLSPSALSTASAPPSPARENVNLSAPQKVTPGATSRAPAASRPSSHRSTVPGELSDPWAQ